VIPGKAADPLGFVTTGCVLGGWDPEVIVSVTGVRELMRACEFPSPEAHQELKEERDVLSARVEQLEAECEEYARAFDAIDALESKGLRARRKPGRKPAKETQTEKVNANGRSD